MVLPMKRSTNALMTGLTLACALALSACDQGGETGKVSVRVWGEGYIENGVPEGDVEDGWKVDFERFDTEIKDVKVGGEKVKLESSKIDVTKKSKNDKAGERGQEIGSVEVQEGRHSKAEFTVVKTTVEGKATKGDKTVTFKWVFDEPVRYFNCRSETKVKAGSDASFEITMHADHYLYDTLTGHEDPKLYFGPIAAADADEDGTITQEELEKAEISDDFDTGSKKVKNMWSWLIEQNATVAHTDGEGHCSTETSAKEKKEDDK